jgi:3-hydroxybutyryl-CoA dehydratase
VNGKTIRELAIGQKASFSKTITEHDVYAFAGITGDFNPAHIDSVYAESTVFKTRIVHGALTAGLVSAVFAMQLPGPGAIYVSMNLNFLKPVYFNDTITADVEVVDMDVEKNRVSFRTCCTNQKKEVVAEGQSVLMPRKEKAVAR